LSGTPNLRIVSLKLAWATLWETVFKKGTVRPGRMAEVVQHLPSQHEAMSSEKNKEKKES
jgi:hypothetical protein